MELCGFPLFFFYLSVHLHQNDACWHIFGQGRASLASERCLHSCEVITPNRSKTVATLFIHCWQARWAAAHTSYSEVMTFSWLSAPSQIQTCLCVPLLCGCAKGHLMRHIHFQVGFSTLCNNIPNKWQINKYKKSWRVQKNVKNNNGQWQYNTVQYWMW